MDVSCLKRGIDLLIASTALLIFLPLMIIIAICIRIKLGKPVIYKQKRPGLYEKPFYLYKFRTMTNETDENGNLLPDSVRLTNFGKFLRKYSLDELPQLWNVFKGELSIVGPRPLLVEYLPLYTEEERRRHEVKPGITGWAQVNGRNAISWEEKFRLDVWYVDNQSIWLDIKILWLTIIKVLRSEGITYENSVTMPVFKGSKKEVKKVTGEEF